MSTQDLEQRARELLAAEYRIRKPYRAGPVLRGNLTRYEEAALRAIVAALRQQPAPVDLEQFREAVEFMQMRGTREQCIRAGDMLQAIIDNAGKMAHQSAPVVDAVMSENAARYEWLKKKGKFAAEGLAMRDPERWDEAIDHARAQGGAVVKFKPGDKVLNVGNGFNTGKSATVLAVNPAGFPDAPECDLLLHAPDAMMLPGWDGLYKEHKMYSLSEFWKREE